MLKDAWLLSVCESMFQLNVLNRIKQSEYRYIIYQLKNDLVKYLYQTKHCTEALLHCQKFPCWSCNGTGEYWTGEVCFKCGGTGVFREVWHYAFRFEVAGRRFSWHQPKTMIDFPVTLTPGLPEIYRDPILPDKDNIALFQRRAGLSIWNVFFFLLLHEHGSSISWFLELPWLRELRWELRRNYYRFIDRPVEKLRSRLRAWVTGNPIDEPPF